MYSLCFLCFMINLLLFTCLGNTVHSHASASKANLDVPSFCKEMNQKVSV